MIEFVKYQYELWKLENRMKSLLKTYDFHEKRIMFHSQNDLMELKSMDDEVENLQKWTEFLKTEYYFKRCNKLIIPIPEKSNNSYYYEFNFDDDLGDRKIFTTEGFSKVRSLIRQEMKEKGEIVTFWTSTIIGIIGSLIGLITVIK
ncbi:MAG: hypothetical protein ACK4R6_13150 [Spirosomataceae bacterium]